MVNKTTLIEKDLGTFLFGDFRVRLMVNNQWGGVFYFAYEGDLPRIVVGTASQDWERIVSGLLHEAYELETARMGYRFSRSNDFSNDHSEYIFMFNHPQFSDLCGKVSVFITKALPKVATAWKKIKKEEQCRSKSKRSARNRKFSKKESRKKAKRIAGSGKPVSNT